jgi:hypothetical protein
MGLVSVAAGKGSLDLIEPREQELRDCLCFVDQWPAREDKRRQLYLVAIDLDVIGNPLGIADEIDCGRARVENIERRPSGDAGEEAPLKP